MGAAMAIGRLAMAVEAFKWIYENKRILAFLVFFGLCIACIVWCLVEHSKLDELRKVQFTPIRQVEGFQKIRAGRNSYKVHEDLENPEEAAQLMDKLNTTATTLIDYLLGKFNNPAALEHIVPSKRATVLRGIRDLKAKFKTASLEENIPSRSGGDTSYVIDKGEVFAMCLRDPKNNNKIDDKYNNLVFVLLHELAHIANFVSFGHDMPFWNMFKFLLQEATELGIYQPVNYKQTGSPCCGIVITYSPLFDGALSEWHASPPS
jgi:hypothetical protein